MISRASTSRRLFSINRKEDLITTYVAFIFVAIQILSNSIIPILLKSINTPIQVALYLSFIIILIVAYPNYRLQPKSLLLIIATATSIVVNEIDAKYMAGTRWILWVLLLASIGPLFSNKILLRLRIKILNIFLYGFIIVTIISFIYYLLGLPQIGRGNFGGIINHSMRLGPIAAISGIYSFYKYLINNRLKTKYYYLAISAISGLVVILAASRLAFAGFIAGMIFLFAKPFKNRIIYAFLIISMGIVVYARIDEGVEKTKQSIDKGLVEKGTNNSRESLWNDRIIEFRSSPIFGVGFSAQNDRITESDIGGGKMGGRVEPGSGYLMILSMTGIFGLLLFLWYFYFLFNSKRFWNEIFKQETYKLSIFAFFAVHFIGEGYVYSAGSMLGSLFWLMVGVTFPYANVKKQLVRVKTVKKATLI
jgi:O-antigen ligase